MRSLLLEDNHGDVAAQGASSAPSGAQCLEVGVGLQQHLRRSSQLLPETLERPRARSRRASWSLYQKAEMEILWISSLDTKTKGTRGMQKVWDQNPKWLRRKEEIELTEGQKPEKSALQKPFYIHLHNNTYLPYWDTSSIKAGLCCIYCSLWNSFRMQCHTWCLFRVSIANSHVKRVSMIPQQCCWKHSQWISSL